MPADVQKKNSHHHAHHHAHHHYHNHKKALHLKSIERIIHLPVVESAQQYYEKIKNSSTLIKWSLFPAETGVWLAVGTALPVVGYFQGPVSAVDSIVCQGLDVIEANLPVVTYPPELVYNITKDYVTSKVVVPVLKRADSVKQLSISGANICGEMAANGLNNAIDVADKYVEKYLPDIADVTDTSSEPPSAAGNSDSKTVQTIQHVNKFSRKLQRRITRRTIAEAKALRQQSADTIRCLVYLVDLLARDPKAFMDKAKEVWIELSKDEPENQVPPANLEQLIAMLTREMARRIVHLANYSSARIVVLSHQSLHMAHVAALNAVWWADYFIKMMHMETALDMAATQVTKLHRLSVEMIEKLFELIKRLKQEGLKSPENTNALPSSASVPQPQPPQPQATPALTASSAPFPVASQAPPTYTVTPSSPSPPVSDDKPGSPQKNGDPHHSYESE